VIKSKKTVRYHAKNHRAVRGTKRQTGSCQEKEKLQNYTQLECGPMPNLMVALPNIGGALCSTPQSLADAHY